MSCEPTPAVAWQEYWEVRQVDKDSNRLAAICGSGMDVTIHADWGREPWNWEKITVPVGAVYYRNLLNSRFNKSTIISQ